MRKGIDMRRCITACAVAWAFGVTGALATEIVVEPPSVLLSNFDRVLVGSQGGLEGGALLVRAKASEAAWYNPAGLVRCRAPSISGNASAYELVTNEFDSGSITSTSSDINTLPTFIGSSDWITRGPGDLGSLAWGYAIAMPLSWNSNTNNHTEFTDSDDFDAKVSSQAHASIDTLGMGATLSYAHTEPYAVPGFTYGMSAFVYMTALGIQESRFEDHRSTFNDDFRTVTRDYELGVDATHLSLTFGMFAKPVDKIELAAVVRLPGIKVSASGSLNEHEVTILSDALPGTPEYDEKDAREEGVDVEWELPLEVSAGIAYKGEKSQLEFDVNYHAGGGNYNVFPAGLYNNRSGDFGAPPGFEGTTVRDALGTTSEAVVNIAVGYRYEFGGESEPRFHAGLRRSLSPVKADSDDEDIFQAMDLTIVTLGFSKQTSNTFTSVGLVMGFGSSDDFTLDDIATPGDTVGGSLSTTTIGLVLGASFKL